MTPALRFVLTVILWAAVSAAAGMAIALLGGVP
jgi:hypothetical protein